MSRLRNLSRTWRALQLLPRTTLLTAPRLHRRLAPPLAGAFVLGSAVVLGCGVGVCDGERKDKIVKNVETEQTEEAKYALIAVKKEALDKLRAQYEAKLAVVPTEAAIVVEIQPSKEQVLDWDDLLDGQVDIKIVGIIDDDQCQLAVVESEHLHVQPQLSRSFIPLSKTENCTETYMMALMEDAFVQGKLADKYLVKGEPITVNGTFCVNTKWSDGSCHHEQENTCSFCMFMKAGPCRHEFIAWEKCVDIPNSDKEDNDFVDRCASQTLVLKSCVDNNPEYYYVVSENEKDQEVVRRAQEKVQQDELAKKTDTSQDEISETNTTDKDQNQAA